MRGETMSKNITLFGQDFTAVPALNVPLQGGGTARFIDEDDAGGGDFSSAEGTFINTSTRGASAQYYLYIPYIDEDNECIVDSDAPISVIPSNPITLKLPLYKNVIKVTEYHLSSIVNYDNITVTGDITRADGWLTITGNGTISAEGAYL